jgi:GntR family transcriptional regulator, transcriptional repressor for pyruvate dehydrogenase complex
MSLTSGGIKAESLADQVHRQLLNAIRVGEFAGQTRLPSETEMAAHYQVSRPVLRQALTQLRAAGIIASKRGSGNYVVDAVEPSFAFDPLGSIPDVQKCLEFRCAVEGQAAATAARMWTQSRLDRIREAQCAFESLVAGRTPAVGSDIAFHLAIAEATNNSFYVQTLKALRVHITFGIQLIQSLSARPTAVRLAGVIAEHRLIVEAIAERRPDEARRHMSAHLQAGIDRLFPTADPREAEERRAAP